MELPLLPFVSFPANAGPCLFDGDEGRHSERLWDYLEQSLGDRVRFSMVEFADGRVTLRGRAVSAEARDAAVLLAGNLHGVEEVHYCGLAVQSGAADVGELYEVQHGDSLVRIARHCLGDEAHVDLLLAVNRGVISDPDLLFPGQVIRMPFPCRGLEA
jgi:nucleoid-associated protein YgaU